MLLAFGTEERIGRRKHARLQPYRAPAPSSVMTRRGPGKGPGYWRWISTQYSGHAIIPYPQCTNFAVAPLRLADSVLFRERDVGRSEHSSGSDPATARLGFPAVPTPTNLVAGTDGGAERRTRSRVSRLAYSVTVSRCALTVFSTDDPDRCTGRVSLLNALARYLRVVAPSEPARA